MVASPSEALVLSQLALVSGDDFVYFSRLLSTPNSVSPRRIKQSKKYVSKKVGSTL